MKPKFKVGDWVYEPNKKYKFQWKINEVILKHNIYETSYYLNNKFDKNETLDMDIMDKHCRLDPEQQFIEKFNEDLNKLINS